MMISAIKINAYTINIHAHTKSGAKFGNYDLFYTN